MNRLDTIDRMTARLGMLQAQALALTDGGEEPFLRLAGEIRSNYFWAMLLGLEECLELLKNQGDLDDDDTLARRLRAMRAQCIILMSDAMDDSGRLFAHAFGDLMTGMADNLTFCRELAGDFAPAPPRPAAGAIATTSAALN